MKTSFLLFLGSAALGVWASYDLVSALAKFTQLALAIVIYFAIAAWSEKYEYLAAGLAMGLAAAISVYFLWTADWVQQPADLEFINRTGLAWMRSRPSLPVWLPGMHPNIAGGLIAALLPFSLASVLTARDNRHPAWLVGGLFLSGVSLVGLLMTSSRAAWLALLAGLALWLWWKSCVWLAGRLSVRLPLLFILPPSLILIFAGLFLWGQIAGGIPAQDSLPGAGSAVSRLEIAWNSLHLARDFYFTGGGLAAFPGIYSRYMRVIQVYEFGYAHNLYLDLLVEQGFLGLGSFLWIMAASLAAAARSLFAQREIAAPVMAGLVVMLLHGLFDDAFYGMSGTSLLFVLPGLASALDRPPVASPLAQKPESGGRQLFLGLVLVELVVLALLPWNRAGAFANLGAVQMSKLHLAGWPEQQVILPAVPSGSRAALKSVFEKSLSLDAENTTALYRLGILSTEEGDFAAAVSYLEPALASSPDHRGVRKLLGYNCIWIDRPEQALEYLSTIPEAVDELDYYIWWWETQSRVDLSQKAREVREWLVSR